MPKALEEKLEREAEKRGYTGRRKDRYVYGTLNKMGLLNSNHAGALAPEHYLKGIKMKFDYDPTFDNVHGVHIAVFVALIVVALYVFTGYRPGLGFIFWRFANRFGGPRVQNGNGASEYISTRSVEGWEAVQYHSLGANAGATVGESD